MRLFEDDAIKSNIIENPDNAHLQLVFKILDILLSLICFAKSAL